jgi:hypothetical protein
LVWSYPYFSLYPLQINPLHRISVKVQIGQASIHSLRKLVRPILCVFAIAEARDSFEING